MLRELCTEGYSLLSRDETGKTALHYGARYNNTLRVQRNGKPIFVDKN